jgi:hypothetical protein
MDQKSLPATLPEVKVFDLQLVDGHCITHFDIYYVTPIDGESYVRAVAFPRTPREYLVLIDKADHIEDLSKNVVSKTVWIDLDLGYPTPLSQNLGAAIEAKCSERFRE